MEELPYPRVISADVRLCVEATSECYKACTETLNYSLDGGPFMDQLLLRRLIDCCEVLQSAENGLLRGSELTLMLAAVCAEACESVAESCRFVGAQDSQLAACAEACDETAECCRRLAI